MLTDWLDSVLEEPSRQIGITAERLAIQAGGGALAAATNIAFEEFTTTLLNTVGKALLGLGLVASTTEIIPSPITAISLDDRTKQELLIIGSAIGLDGIYRAVRNLSATQTAINQFIDTLKAGNILGAFQMLIKNPFSSFTGTGNIGTGATLGASYSPLGTVNIISPTVTVTEEEPSYEYSYGYTTDELTVPNL
ncbi:MAG: hypothetical protein QW475_04530 [Candidatus Nitrosocaldus sp.]